MWPSKFVIFGLMSMVVHLNAKIFYYDGITIDKFMENVFGEAFKRYPELKINGTIEPMDLGDFTVKNGEFVVKNTNTVLNGMKDAKLSSIGFDFEKGAGGGQIYANVTLTSDYEASGTFLFLPISTSGKLSVYGHRVIIEVSFRFRTVIVKSEAYLEIYDVHTTQEFGYLKFNLTSSCKAADDMVNAALNYNWKLLQKVGAAQTADIVAVKVEDYVNSILSQIPLFEFLKHAVSWAVE